MVLDVREAIASRRRADGEARTSTVRLRDGSRLTFVSRPAWARDRIVVEERYELDDGSGPPIVSDYVFQMRPWTRDEVHEIFTGAGFTDVQVRAGVGRRTPDRLLVTASPPA